MAQFGVVCFAKLALNLSLNNQVLLGDARLTCFFKMLITSFLQKSTNNKTKMDQTSAKLRKTFRYPTEDDSEDSLPEAMDEQGSFTTFQPRSDFSLPSFRSNNHHHTDIPEEQENLIRTMQQQTITQNKIYNNVFLVLPLVCVLPYLTTLFQPQTSLLSLLSITSLLSTAFLVYILPPGITSINFLDALNVPPPSKSRRSTGPIHQPQGPIETFLPYMNIVLSMMLGLLGMVTRGKEELWMGFAWLPGAIYAIVIGGKWVMGSVNPEDELGGLRYGFKGA